MTWTKLDDNFTAHPKVMRISLQARWLFIEGLVYANKWLTDGELPRPFPFQLPDPHQDYSTPPVYARELVDAGLWEDPGDRWVIHNFHKWNPSREEVLERQEQRRAAGRAGGKASGQARAEAGASSPAKRAVEQNGSKNEPRTRTRTSSRRKAVDERSSSALRNTLLRSTGGAGESG